MAQMITKAAMIREIAAQVGLPKSQVAMVLEVQAELVELLAQKAKVGDTIPALPGVVTLRKARRKATKARTGHNPATGEPIRIKARPARNVLRARVLKSVQDAVK